MKELVDNLCSLYVYTYQVKAYYKKKSPKGTEIELLMDGIYLINEKEQMASKIEWCVVEKLFPMPTEVKKHFDKTKEIV